MLGSRGVLGGGLAFTSSVVAASCGMLSIGSSLVSGLGFVGCVGLSSTAVVDSCGTVSESSPLVSGAGLGGGVCALKRAAGRSLFFFCSLRSERGKLHQTEFGG